MRVDSMREKPIFDLVIHVKSYSTSVSHRFYDGLFEPWRTIMRSTITRIQNYIIIYARISQLKSHLIDEQNQNIIKSKRDMSGGAFNSSFAALTSRFLKRLISIFSYDYLFSASVFEH